MKRLILAVFATLMLTALPASAGKPEPIGPLQLTRERLLQPYFGPTTCLDEDDWHLRRWEGSLNGTFTTTENYCDLMYEGQYYDGGGESIGLRIYGTGRLASISISGRDKWGTFYERTEAVLVYSTVIGKGRNARVWNEYVACVSLRSPGYTGWMFAGPWNVQVTGEFENVIITVESAMFIAIENQYCPVGQKPQ